MPITPMAAIVSTHTTRHLRLTLLGLSLQSHRPNYLVVSCDNDAPEILQAVRDCARDFHFPITLVQRAHAGVARLGQVRNNAVRALQRLNACLPPVSRLVFFDGDILTGRRVLELHDALAASDTNRLVIAFRRDLTEAQTQAITEDQVRAADPESFVTLDPSVLRALRTRDRRYRRQALMRRLHLAKAHKPKMLGANFSVSLEAYLAVNGCDERFEGYGQEDDDLSRRLYQHGCTPAIGVAAIPNFHLFHPTRAPASWDSSPTVRLLHSQAPTRCLLGIDNPKPQEALRIEHFPAPSNAPPPPLPSPAAA
ncbi:MAG TPA: galactosyltransferase-related protein [Phycisphaerales bacterium]|nr:galactosyltransferase-related protein [Phycisphaerales bacterium]